MSKKWDAAVERAGEDPETDLAEAVKNELASLWSDLDTAMRYALKGDWSMQCDWITERIIRLSRLTDVTPWGQVPYTLLLSGIYQGILTSAGFEFDTPGEA